MPLLVPPGDGTTTTFRGLTREAVRTQETGLYEVLTTDGVPVRLHDMSFLGLTFEPSSPPSLVLRFGYDDPTWTPDVAMATPVAVFAFSDVVVLQHDDVPVEPGTPAGAVRQVCAFDHHEATATFTLSTFTTHVVFTASALTVSLESAEERPPVAHP